MNTTMTKKQSQDPSTLDYVNEQYSALTEATKQCVVEKPVTSSLITFGAGFAIGVAVSAVLGQSESSQRRNFANQISNQVMNGLAGFMPKSFRS